MFQNVNWISQRVTLPLFYENTIYSYSPEHKNQLFQVSTLDFPKTKANQKHYRPIKSAKIAKSKLATLKTFIPHIK